MANELETHLCRAYVDGRCQRQKIVTDWNAAAAWMATVWAELHAEFPAMKDFQFAIQKREEGY